MIGMFTFQELERLAEEQYNGCSSESLCGISGNGNSPRRDLPPFAVGYNPALAAHLFANTLLNIAKLKFMRMGARFCHLR